MRPSTSSIASAALRSSGRSCTTFMCLCAADRTTSSHLFFATRKRKPPGPSPALGLDTPSFTLNQSTVMASWKTSCASLGEPLFCTTYCRTAEKCWVYNATDRRTDRSGEDLGPRPRLRRYRKLGPPLEPRCGFNDNTANSEERTSANGPRGLEHASERISESGWNVNRNRNENLVAKGGSDRSQRRRPPDGVQGRALPQTAQPLNCHGAHPWPFVPLVLFLGLQCASLAQSLHFQHLTTVDGLSGNAVTCVSKGTEGYIWLGTDNGLCRYDGQRVERFPGGGWSRRQAHFLHRCQDKRDRLWVTTIDGGLSMRDPRDGAFSNYRQDSTDAAHPDRPAEPCAGLERYPAFHQFACSVLIHFDPAAGRSGPPINWIPRWTAAT